MFPVGHHAAAQRVVSNDRSRSPLTVVAALCDRCDRAVLLRARMAREAGDSGAPPIPEQVVGSDGTILFTNADIALGQQVFLRYGLMENGTIWGHGAYLGPDFSADYLHTLALDTEKTVAERLGFVMQTALPPSQRLIAQR